LIKDLGPNWWVKIGDFGISKRAEEGGTVLRTLNGTPGFLAPEILVQNGMMDVEGFPTEQAYTNKCDIWSLGEIIYRSTCGESPFPKSLIAYVKGTAKFPLEKLEEYKVSKEGIDFIENLMKAIPEDRLTAAKALEHAWLATQHPSPRSSGEFSRYVAEQLLPLTILIGVSSLEALPSTLSLPATDSTEQSGSASEWAQASACWSTLDDTSALTNEAAQTIMQAAPVDVPIEKTPAPPAGENSNATVAPCVAEQSASPARVNAPDFAGANSGKDLTDEEKGRNDEPRDMDLPAGPSGQNDLPTTPSGSHKAEGYSTSAEFMKNFPLLREENMTKDQGTAAIPNLGDENSANSAQSTENKTEQNSAQLLGMLAEHDHFGTDSKIEKEFFGNILHSPPKKPLPPPKGILRKPTEKFPENPVSLRKEAASQSPSLEGEAVERTKISRSRLDLEVLREAGERFTVYPNYIIVHRFLTEVEIARLTIRTYTIRAERG
jgi:serine/threonine protein kinase